MPLKKTSTKGKKKIKKAAKTKKTVKKRTARPSKRAPLKKAPVLKPIGKVTHFYGHIKVAIVRFSKPIKKGSAVLFKGATTDFSQKLDSMQYDHKAIGLAPKGKQIGIKVKKRVREGDQVYPG